MVFVCIVNFFWIAVQNFQTFLRLFKTNCFYFLCLGKRCFIIADFTALCQPSASYSHSKPGSLNQNPDRLTMDARLMQAPVDAQAVLLLLHASPALAAVQRTGEERRHGVGTLAAGAGAQLHAAVARHTLPQRSQARATRLVAGARVPRQQTVSPSRQGLLKRCGGKGRSW